MLTHSHTAGVQCSSSGYHSGLRVQLPGFKFELKSNKSHLLYCYYYFKMQHTCSLPTMQYLIKQSKQNKIGGEGSAVLAFEHNMHIWWKLKHINQTEVLKLAIEFKMNSVVLLSIKQMHIPLFCGQAWYSTQPTKMNKKQENQTWIIERHIRHCLKENFK